MEYVDFYPKTFAEIEEQDNPAFGDTECLMIVREVKADYESKRYVVLHIEPKDDPKVNEAVTRIAVFWKGYIAQWFCKNFNPENL